MSLPTRELRWESDELPITPSAIHSPPYTYGPAKADRQDELRLDDIAWETPDRLADRIKSGDLAPNQKPPTKKWLLAQLHLYGIPHHKTGRVDDLKAALVKAWKDGQCIDLAPSIATVRDRLQNEYNEAFERLEDQLFQEIGDNPSSEAQGDERRFIAKYFQDAQGRPDKYKTQEALCFASPASWEEHRECLKKAVGAVPGLAIHLVKDKAVVGWEGTIQRGIETEFSRLEDHHRTHKAPEFCDSQARYQSEEANLHLDLFLRKTLCIDKNGEVVTEGLFAERFDDITVIGWDANNIKVEIKRLRMAEEEWLYQEQCEEQQMKTREEAETKARWDRRSKPYRDLVARQQRPWDPWDIQHLVGSYIVHWDSEKLKEYGEFNDPTRDHDLMRIDIFPSKSADGVKASFRFGLFEGIIIFAKSSRKLERFRKSQPKGSSEPGEDSDYGTSGEDSEEDHQGTNRQSGTTSAVDNEANLTKRPQTGQKRTIGDISDPWGVNAARLKRQQLGSTSAGAKPEPEQREEPTQNSHLNRVYFQFVANLVDGYPEVDYKNENLGHLDFDETRLAAEDKFVWPSYFGEGEPQSISIFKVAEQPNREHEPGEWYMYDGRSWGFF
ncbi:uncharacterized protein C8A04DRAFT_31920 [Dichotomopilus funicola]|uniref:Uncharacterized protein n=1 Tax=Dichotomopilus funicola TaxID=1934379 RepID=A0AAN6UX55_9PEZI|nr:hypothetical protein C8A04DRAFT_31920 [Dichotomopilus funicola]